MPGTVGGADNGVPAMAQIRADGRYMGDATCYVKVDNFDHDPAPLIPKACYCIPKNESRCTTATFPHAVDNQWRWEPKSNTPLIQSVLAHSVLGV